jgi:cytochrome c5
MNAANAGRINAAYERDAQLGDVVAEYDCPVHTAGKWLGIPKSTTSAAWKRICKRLGAQAI